MVSFNHRDVMLDWAAQQAVASQGLASGVEAQQRFTATREALERLFAYLDYQQLAEVISVLRHNKRRAAHTSTSADDGVADTAGHSKRARGSRRSQLLLQDDPAARHAFDNLPSSVTADILATCVRALGGLVIPPYVGAFASDNPAERSVVVLRPAAPVAGAAAKLQAPESVASVHAAAAAAAAQAVTEPASGSMLYVPHMRTSFDPLLLVDPLLKAHNTAHSSTPSERVLARLPLEQQQSSVAAPTANQKWFKVLVSNLPADVTPQQLLRAFAPCGRVMGVEIFRHALNGWTIRDFAATVSTSGLQVLHGREEAAKGRRTFKVAEALMQSPVFGHIYFHSEAEQMAALRVDMRAVGVVISKRACPTSDVSAQTSLKVQVPTAELRALISMRGVPSSSASRGADIPSHAKIRVALREWLIQDALYRRPINGVRFTEPVLLRMIDARKGVLCSMYCLLIRVSDMRSLALCIGQQTAVLKFDSHVDAAVGLQLLRRWVAQRQVKHSAVVK